MSSESIRVFYLQHLCDTSLGENAFKAPWGSLILKNCNSEGELYDFKTINQFKDSRKQLWLLLSLKVFRYQDFAFPIFCCSECEQMKTVENLGLYADPCEVSNLQCLHSKAAGFLLKNWEEIWKVELEDSDTALAVFCYKEVEHFTFQHHSRTKPFLAGVQLNGKVFLLQTVTMRQKFPFSPFCSKCSRQSCVHWLTYKKMVDEKEEFAFNQHIHEVDGNASFDDVIIEHSHDDEDESAVEMEDDVDVEDEDNEVMNRDNEVTNEDDDVDSGSEDDVEDGYDITNGDDDVDSASEDEVDTIPERMHWRTMPPIEKYHKLYGYNISDILYPFQRDKDLQTGWLERMNGVYSFPNQFIPVWSLSNLCKHNNIFDRDDDNLGRHSRNIVVYSHIGERLFAVDVMYRKTMANCKCIQQYDSHKYLLWHLGFGRFVDYTFLHQHLHRMRKYGVGTYAEYKSINESLESIGISSTLTYHDLHRAVCGFYRKLKFDESTAFSCPTHGNSPRFLNTDGKNMGPTKRKVKHLEELERHPDDDEVLPQSTFFGGRVFMPEIKERRLVVELLADKMSMMAFCNSEVQSENGRLLVNLVRVLDNTYDVKVPSPYKRLIENICKPTSVRGLTQVTGPEPLEYLKQFCLGRINIKSLQHKNKLQCVIKQLPVLWPMLDDICNFEKSSVLPQEVCDIVLRLLSIRENMFRNAAPRDENAYHKYESSEEPSTMCYPNNPTIKHPKKYEVNKVKDKDLCEKAFFGHSHFAAGIFTAGCACKYNITLGWEIMLNNESPRNLFRLLTCNRFDLEKMDGVLMDHACKFDAYMLNREAEPLEYLLTLVDGSHWNAQKKMKYPNSKGKGGHLGCSEGYNWNLYKASYGKEEAVNSQGREQMHAVLENLSKSMRLLNYQHFMLFLYVFFATTNIHNRGYK